MPQNEHKFGVFSKEAEYAAGHISYISCILDRWIVIRVIISEPTPKKVHRL